MRSRPAGEQKHLGLGTAALTMAASGKIFLRAFETLVGVSLILLSVWQPVSAGQATQGAAPQYVIERVEFVGNRRVQRDTLLARIFSRIGDPYTVEGVRRDFQALWNTQFFEDIRLEVEDSPDRPDGKILVYYVSERPIIRRIEYKGNKSITESDILDAFKDKKVGLTVESQFDPTKIIRAEVVIKGLLAAHGRQFATVKPTYERIAATNAVKLTFNIEEGAKVKVGTITIEGNKAFSSRKIIRTMRNDRPYSIPLGFTFIPVLGKTFDQDKLEEDMEVGIRGLYQDNGYYKVNVNVASTKTVDENKGGIPGPWPLVGSKHGKETNITISVDEGAQYRMGKLLFRSADPDQGLVFKPEFLAKVFPLKEGDLFSGTKIRKSLEDFRKLYGEYGYIDFTATPLTDTDDTKKLVNLTMEFDQQKQFFVRRIEFSGNTTTRDKVIRRELLIDEGQVFNNRYWELSILRLNQLGYFDTIKPDNAELNRNVKAGTVDINLKLKEKGKQSISFSGGVSGISGSFIGASYQTNNFLGLGETLTISAQVGDIQKNVQFGFTEPYLFDRPISTGFTIFLSKFDYNTARQYGQLFGQQVAIDPALQQNYNTDSKGFTAFAGYPVRKLSKTGFARVSLQYGWSTTNITTFSQSASLLFNLIQFRSFAGPSALQGIESSKVTGSLSFSNVNSPQNPTAGKSFSYGLSFEGGPLRGNVNSISNTVNYEYFHPTYHKRNVIGLRVMAANIAGYGGKDVPPFSRFYLGGENDVRGYDFYTISPFVAIPNQTTTTVTYFDPRRLDQNGRPIQLALAVPTLEFVPSRPGGDTQAIFNADYRIPIAGPVTLVFYNDLGLVGDLFSSQLHLDPAAVGALQQQYPNPDFPNLKISGALPTISGTNFRPHTSAGVELEVVLPIVNAPFRIYYAYNYLRLNQTIEAPLGAFSLTDAQKAALPPGVLETQIVPELATLLQQAQASQRIPPSLLEPKSTFRFTVGRTF